MRDIFKVAAAVISVSGSMAAADSLYVSVGAMRTDAKVNVEMDAGAGRQRQQQ